MKRLEEAYAPKVREFSDQLIRADWQLARTHPYAPTTPEVLPPDETATIPTDATSDRCECD